VDRALQSCGQGGQEEGVAEPGVYEGGRGEEGTGGGFQYSTASTVTPQGQIGNSAISACLELDINITQTNLLLQYSLTLYIYALHLPRILTHIDTKDVIFDPKISWSSSNQGKGL
jgi:hypothetical protein